MKKKLIIVLAVLSAGLVYLTLADSNPPLPGGLSEVSETEKAEVEKVIKSAVNIYNKSGKKTMRRLFSASKPIPKSLQKLGMVDTVGKSIDTLSYCGKKLEITDTKVLRRNTTAKNNRSYILTATVKPAGKQLDFELIKRKKRYSLTRISNTVPKNH